METVRKQKAFYNKDFRYVFREIKIQHQLSTANCLLI